MGPYQNCLNWHCRETSSRETNRTKANRSNANGDRLQSIVLGIKWGKNVHGDSCYCNARTTQAMVRLPPSPLPDGSNGMMPGWIALSGGDASPLLKQAIG